MLKITISEITEPTSTAQTGPSETVVYTQQFKELNVQQLVTSINKPVRVRKSRAVTPLKGDKA